MTQMTIEPKTPATTGHTSASAPAPTVAPVSAAAPGGAKSPQTPAPTRHNRPRVVIAAALVVAGLAAFGAWTMFFAASGIPAGVIAVSGRIEGDDSVVGAKTSGRIREITVREGDHVQAGQVIATLDDQQIRAREQMAEAAVRQAEARVELSKHQITVLEEQLRQNEIGVDQARADAAGRVSEARRPRPTRRPSGIETRTPSSTSRSSSLRSKPSRPRTTRKLRPRSSPHRSARSRPRRAR